MNDRKLMELALNSLEYHGQHDPLDKDLANALRERLSQLEPDYKPDFDLLFEANSADIEALQDAQFTLEAIKNADPGTYDEIIDASLRLIKVALSRSVFGPIERIAKRIGVEI